MDWERRCRVQANSGHCTGADALFLVTALSGALRSGSETPELGRAARTWGSRFSTPVEALSVLTLLRDAVIDLNGAGGDAGPVPSPTLNRLFDQMSMEAVDAASANLRAAARHDALTGCANRRALDEDLPRALASAERSKLDLAVAVVDVDGLKQINDEEGHAAGDDVLRSLVDSLRLALREADTLYRSGGDEFVVVAPFTDAAGARALMRRTEHMGAPHFSWGVAGLSQARAMASGDGAQLSERPRRSDGIGAGAFGALALLELADADLYRRRRAARRAAALAGRRRRVTTVASVAATVTVTAGMATLAAALSSGGPTPVSPPAQAARAASGTGSSPVPPVWAALGPRPGGHNQTGSGFLTSPARATTIGGTPPVASAGSASASGATGGGAVLTSAVTSSTGGTGGGPAAASLIQVAAPLTPQGHGHGQSQGPKHSGPAGASPHSHGHH